MPPFVYPFPNSEKVDKKDRNDPGPEDKIEDFPREKYWEVVRETVRRVFNSKNLDQVGTIRSKIEGVAQPRQYRFYQTDPYSVAADIAGEAGPGTDNQWRTYLDIRKEKGFGSVEIPPDMHKPYQS